jgi:hypothetical protein
MTATRTEVVFPFPAVDLDIKLDGGRAIPVAFSKEAF